MRFQVMPVKYLRKQRLVLFANDNFSRFIVEIKHKFPCHLVEVLNRAKTHFGLLINFDKQLAADDVENAAFALSLRKRLARKQSIEQRYKNDGRKKINGSHFVAREDHVSRIMMAQ